MNGSPWRGDMTRTGGFGLVEIMIAMTLGLFILAGLYEVYLANKTTYRLQQALSQLQENTRYAVQTMSRDIRMAGYAGCLRFINQNLNVITPDSAVTDFLLDRIVVGTDNPSQTNSTPDTVTISGASGNGAHLSSDMTTNGASQVALVTSPEGLSNGDLALIADCGNADLFNFGSTTQNISKLYQTHAEVSAFRVFRYYVADSGTTRFPNGSWVPALYRQDLSTDPDTGVPRPAAELVQGVQDMQIDYGINTDGDSQQTADSYKSADQVSDWTRVVSVRIALLLKSLKPVTDTPDETTTYMMLGNNTVGPFNDRYLRRSTTFTVALRSRVH